MEGGVLAGATKGDNGMGQPAAHHNLETVCNLLYVNRAAGRTLIESIPFAPGDVTAGCENELQAVVVGGAHQKSVYARRFVTTVGTFHAEAARLSGPPTPAILRALKRAGRKYVYPVNSMFTSY
jgi:hypothetical protein